MVDLQLFIVHDSLWETNDNRLKPDQQGDLRHPYKLNSSSQFFQSLGVDSSIYCSVLCKVSTKITSFLSKTVTMSFFVENVWQHLTGFHGDKVNEDPTPLIVFFAQP